MTDTPAGSAPSPAVPGHHPGRRRAAGIYGTIISSAVIAAGGHSLRPVPLAITVIVTLLVYWIAEQYAELLGEQAHAGRLPTWARTRELLAASWPMVTASYIPLLALLVTRALGATPVTAANVALIVAIGLLLVHGWNAGRAAELHGLRLFVTTSISGALGVAMILLKLLVTH
jgi:hypothetical protein